MRILNKPIPGNALYQPTPSLDAQPGYLRCHVWGGGWDSEVIAQRSFLRKLTSTRWIGYIFATVQNVAVWRPLRCHAWGMLSKKPKKELDNATLAGIKKELAKPRIAKSARIAGRNPGTTRMMLIAIRDEHDTNDEAQEQKRDIGEMSQPRKGHPSRSEPLSRR
jgi:hypothetical protein